MHSLPSDYSLYMCMLRVLRSLSLFLSPFHFLFHFVENQTLEFSLSFFSVLQNNVINLSLSLIYTFRISFFFIFCDHFSLYVREINFLSVALLFGDYCASRRQCGS